MALAHQQLAASAPLVDVSRVLDQAGLNGAILRIVTLAFLVVLVEGYDISAMAFAMPGLMKAWHLNRATALGPVLGASLFGMLVGSPLLGNLGDRHGRRQLIIGACLGFALFTGLTVLATNLLQLCALRFLAGLGLGGAAPNVIALVSEFAPARRRGLIVTVMYSGIGLGGAVAGIAATLLLERYGWLSLFWLGAILPLLIAGACAAWLPESPKYLVVRSRSAEALVILRSVAGDAVRQVVPTQLMIAEAGPEAGPKAGGVTDLFRHGLARPTILIWIAVLGNFMTYHVLLNWSPALLTMARIPAGRASLAQTVFQIGGVLGGMVMGRLLDRRGVVAMAWFLAVSVVPTAMIGVAAGRSIPALFATEFASGFFVLSVAYGFGAVAATIYPTAIRSNGTGWALGAGRAGSLLSTVGAGGLVSAGLPLASLFVIAAVPLMVAALALFALTRRARRHAERPVRRPRPSAATAAVSSNVV